MKILIVNPLKTSCPPKDGHSIHVFYRSYFLKKLAGITSDIVMPKVPNLDNFWYQAFSKTYTCDIKLENNRLRRIYKMIFSKDIPEVIYNKMDFSCLDFLVDGLYTYDTIVFEHSYSYYIYEKLADHINKKNIVYWSQNIDFLDSKSLIKDSKSLKSKLFYYLNYQKLKTIEPAYIKKFRKIASVSKYEVDILRAINNKAKVYWIPPMLPEFKDLEVKKEDIDVLEEKVGKYHHKILFTGILNKSSNIKAAIWFGKEVFPLIKKKLKACFIIVGQSPSKEVIEFVDNKEDVFLFKDVESLAPFYKLSDLVVVPLFNPAGIKLKLLEALKYRKKVVATKEALLGAGLENTVPNAQEKEDFAKKCIDVLEGKIDYNIVWNEFERIYDNKRIVEYTKEVLTY
ncbi:MAG: hypothetical protein C0170_05000 [Hydrogenobaculum sp.]|nr:MAG: hypothetical protein C0170_05000 [Hydrogenobaculum sp.]